ARAESMLDAVWHAVERARRRFDIAELGPLIGIARMNEVDLVPHIVAVIEGRAFALALLADVEIEKIVGEETQRPMCPRDVVGNVGDVNRVDQFMSADDLFDAQRVVVALDACRPIETVDTLFPKPARDALGRQREARLRRAELYRRPVLARAQLDFALQDEVEQLAAFGNDAIADTARDMNETARHRVDDAKLGQEAAFAAMDEVELLMRGGTPSIGHRRSALAYLEAHPVEIRENHRFRRGIEGIGRRHGLERDAPEGDVSRKGFGAEELLVLHVHRDAVAAIDLLEHFARFDLVPARQNRPCNRHPDLLFLSLPSVR